jgi:membrane-bound lytic murein transglycosylase D
MRPPSLQPILAACLLALGANPVHAGEAALAVVTFSLPTRPSPAAPAPTLGELTEGLWSNPAERAPGAAGEMELLPPAEFARLVQRLCAAGQAQDAAELARFAPEARLAIASLRARPGFADYAAWLQNQLDEAEAAAALIRDAGTPPPALPPSGAHVAVPHFAFWLDRLSNRPRPSRADEFLPRLREAFIAEGVPPALVWLAETESSFNPRARSPAGARGLFQLMPDTALSLGLDLRPDERIQPVRSARAAAAYLRHLHGRFGDWPLALAAYNAGESRVARELRRHGAGDFAAIAAHLPAETRFYVPRVLATVQLRAGVAPEHLGAPLDP